VNDWQREMPVRRQPLGIGCIGELWAMQLVEDSVLENRMFHTASLFAKSRKLLPHPNKGSGFEKGLIEWAGAKVEYRLTHKWLENRFYEAKPVPT
jgi:hypothetical protein